MQNYQNKINKISTGSYDLNKFLYGGYEPGIITTFYGPAGSGKTNLCILAAVSQAKKGKKVIFIDTEGGFSSERVKQILNLSKENKQLYNQILQNIILLKPTNFQEQKQEFEKLLKQIKQSKPESQSQISLIIIDGITMLYRLELAEARKKTNLQAIQQINSELAKQLRILAEIARKKQITILVTNQVYSEFLPEQDYKSSNNSQINSLQKQIKMVGGDILKYWSKCIIELTYSKQTRKIILRKHRSLPEKTLNFIITNSGIKKRGWI